MMVRTLGSSGVVVARAVRNLRWKLVDGLGLERPPKDRVGIKLKNRYLGSNLNPSETRMHMWQMMVYIEGFCTEKVTWR